MKLEDMTIEWAREIYKKAGMKPRPGYFYNVDETCGCLVGAMAVSAFEVRDGWALDDLAEHFGFDRKTANFSELVGGFDDGFLEIPPGHPGEWYKAAYDIGRTLGAES